MKEIHIVKILHCLGLLIPYCHADISSRNVRYSSKNKIKIQLDIRIYQLDSPFLQLDKQCWDVCVFDFG